MSTPPLVVAVECDGATASWNGVDFTGDPTLVAYAREAAAGRYGVEWGGVAAAADDTTPLGALTALMYFRPSRTRITVWPVETRQWWESHTYRCCASRDEDVLDFGDEPLPYDEPESENA